MCSLIPLPLPFPICEPPLPTAETDKPEPEPELEPRIGIRPPFISAFCELSVGLVPSPDAIPEPEPEPDPLPLWVADCDKRVEHR